MKVMVNVRVPDYGRGASWVSWDYGIDGECAVHFRLLAKQLTLFEFIYKLSGTKPKRVYFRG